MEMNENDSVVQTDSCQSSCVHDGTNLCWRVKRAPPDRVSLFYHLIGRFSSQSWGETLRDLITVKWMARFVRAELYQLLRACLEAYKQEVPNRKI